MIKKIIVFLLFLFVVLIFNNCEYEPAGEYYREINENVLPPEIATINLELQNDTIYLYDYKYINAEFLSNNQEIHSISVYIDDKELNEIESKTKGTYLLNYSSLTEGIHKLTVQIYTATGSETIAELVGSEKFLISKSWNVNVIKNYKKQSNSTIQNGYLKLFWDNYLGYDFEEYVIYKSIGSSSRIEMGRTNKTEFIDSTYVGEGGYYSITVNTKNQKSYTWADLRLYSEFLSPEVKTTKTNQSILSWKESKYYNAVKLYEIFRTDLINDKFLAAKNDTSYIIENAKFGDRIELRIRKIPKKANFFFTSSEYYKDYESFVKALLGYPYGTEIPEFDGCKYLKQSGDNEFICYFNKKRKLLKFSIDDMEFIDQLNIKLDCNPNESYEINNIQLTPNLEKFISVITNSNCESYNLIADSYNLQNHQLTIPENTLNPYSDEKYFVSLISNNMTGIINKYKEGFYIYDLKNSKMLANYSNPSHSLNTANCRKFSSNGNYMFVSESDSIRLIEYSNSKFKTIWKEKNINRLIYRDSIRYYEFDARDNNRLLYWDGVTFSIKNCNDFSDISNYTLSDKAIINIDYQSSRLLSYIPGHLFVRNLDNGEILYDVLIAFDPTDDSFGNKKCILVNNTIISSRGIIYFIR